MTNRQQRRIVYFLGAGASLGAGATATIQGGGVTPIPTQETFWETFLRFCQSKNNRKVIESFLFRYFLGYSKAPGKLKASKRRRLLKPIDVEEVFTFLSERNHAPETSAQFQLYTKQVWEALLEEIGHVFARFPPNAETKKIYKNFRMKHVRSRDTIVSFNYDVVFEHSLPANYSWFYEVIDDSHRQGALRVLKPHGSINWEEDNGGICVADSPDQPVIIAPTHLKFVGTGDDQNEPDSELRTRIGYLNQSSQIARVWGAMTREMHAAKAWIFVGYSFPSSDLYFSSVLRSVLATRQSHPFVVVVNPDAMAIRARLSARFAIPVTMIRTFSDLQTFNQVSRQKLLEMFQ